MLDGDVGGGGGSGAFNGVGDEGADVEGAATFVGVDAQDDELTGDEDVFDHDAEASLANNQIYLFRG